MQNMQHVPEQRLTSPVHAISVAWEIAPYGMIVKPDWLKAVIAWKVHQVARVYSPPPSQPPPLPSDLPIAVPVVQLHTRMQQEN